MDYTCMGCGSFYNGNSQFCSHSCFFSNCDNDLSDDEERPAKRPRIEGVPKRCDFCRPRPMKQRTCLKYCSDSCFSKHMSIEIR